MYIGLSIVSVYLLLLPHFSVSKDYQSYYQSESERWVAGVVVSLQRGADLHMAQLMPLPLTVSCFSKIRIGFTFLVLAHPGSPGKRAVKRVCVCVNIIRTE